MLISKSKGLFRKKYTGKSYTKNGFFLGDFSGEKSWGLFFGAFYYLLISYSRSRHIIRGKCRLHKMFQMYQILPFLSGEGGGGGSLAFCEDDCLSFLSIIYLFFVASYSNPAT